MPDGYISLEAALKDFEACNAENPRWTPQRVKTLLLRQPAADVATVVHGRWRYFHKQNIAVCTECSFERDLDTNFGRAVNCPNCGAKMDGVDDG